MARVREPRPAGGAGAGDGDHVLRRALRYVARRARRASIESAENDDAALVAACDEWRSVFAATASLRQMVPPDDARVWGRVQRAQEEAREFIQLLGTRLLERLDRFRDDLTARCECASRCGLTTTHRLCCDEDFARECADVRALRAAVEETRGADVPHVDGRLTAAPALSVLSTTS